MSTRRKALANLGAKLSDVPTRATLNAITSAPPRVSAEEPRLVPLELVDPSPFQPRGRPSAGAIEAVREAIEVAGSLSALVTTIEAGAGEPVRRPASFSQEFSAKRRRLSGDLGRQGL